MRNAYRGRGGIAVVALVLGLVAGAGLAVVTPAGAVMAENWSKVWKKQIRPKADKRYYKKAQANQRFQAKGSYATAGSSYTKAESDAKYAPYPKTIRGVYVMEDTASAVGEYAFASISFGSTLAAAPVAVWIPQGGPADPNCTGTAEAPQAAPGHLCVYEALQSNTNARVFASASALVGSASATGAALRIRSAGAGVFASLGGWAVTPAGAVAAKPKTNSTSGDLFGD